MKPKCKTWEFERPLTPERCADEFGIMYAEPLPVQYISRGPVRRKGVLFHSSDSSATRKARMPRMGQVVLRSHFDDEVSLYFIEADRQLRDDPPLAPQKFLVELTAGEAQKLVTAIQAALNRHAAKRVPNGLPTGGGPTPHPVPIGIQDDTPISVTVAGIREVGACPRCGGRLFAIPSQLLRRCENNHEFAPGPGEAL